MYINTHSKTTMQESLCNLLKIDLVDLNNFFIDIRASVQDGILFDVDKFNELVDEFIEQHTPTMQINEILFFHLSRRLNSAKDILGSINLKELLITENDFSKFLKKFSITFKDIENKIELFHFNKHKDLNSNNRVCLYLKSRLGHNKINQDFCLNGFAFKDCLYKNDYARSLSNVPEFINQLAQFLDYDQISFDYYQNSTYYCFEYCIPLNNVIYDGNEYLSLEQKQTYLLRKVFFRLFDYFSSNSSYMYDHDNLILRLKDNENMLDEYYRSKEVINDDMLK
ncbi:hypothetical protein [Thomasclavelia ramosa]|uniref:hypothetical protein n=1 Tax=Thomasclavelia ramosa TaxID=1547 RepID=UPI00191D5419|nr:hypothetical protein [Thomasclavelia ramosa]MCR1956362.1 hypothetical protein [Thomasclavelia ramosa]QQV06426.1 hypothetical protein I6I62_01815 [Thomasclavelia ramosa]